jgi:hypothetical protein
MTVAFRGAVERGDAPVLRRWVVELLEDPVPDVSALFIADTDRAQQEWRQRGRDGGRQRPIPNSRAARSTLAGDSESKR